MERAMSEPILIKENKINPKNPTIRLPQKFVAKLKKKNPTILIMYDEEKVTIVERKN